MIVLEYVMNTANSAHVSNLKKCVPGFVVSSFLYQQLGYSSKISLKLGKLIIWLNNKLLISHGQRVTKIIMILLLYQMINLTQAYTKLMIQMLGQQIKSNKRLKT